MPVKLYYISAGEVGVSRTCQTLLQRFFWHPPLGPWWPMISGVVVRYGITENPPVLWKVNGVREETFPSPWRQILPVRAGLDAMFLTVNKLRVSGNYIVFIAYSRAIQKYRLASIHGCYRNMT